MSCNLIARPVLILAVLGMLTGCAAVTPAPDLGGLYSELASYRDPQRNPIIVIPGFMGSKLVDRDSGETVWGAFGLSAADPDTTKGARLVALPMAEGQSLAELRDGVTSDGALDRVVVNFLGFPVALKAYYELLRSLGVGGYRDEDLGRLGIIDYGEGHFTCFQFDYDWRRDIVESARALGYFIEEKRRYVAEETRRRYGIEGYEPKFDLVAHSTGALVARYYLRYGGAEPPAPGELPVPTWAGARDVERAVLVGPPNAGSVEVIEDLVAGSQPGALFPFYPAGVLGTMPALYQLLPRARHGVLEDRTGKPIADLYDPDLWKENRWGLADPRQDPVLARLLPDVSDPAGRRRIALEHQEKSLHRARRFAAAMDVPAKLPPGLELFLVAGDSVATPQALRVTETGVEARESGPGDGTVLRSSALLDERRPDQRRERLHSPLDWSHVLFLAADHRGITEHPAFIDNILHSLLESEATEHAT